MFFAMRLLFDDDSDILLYILLSYPVDTPVLKVTASVHGRASPRMGGYHIVSVSENGFA